MDIIFFYSIVECKLIMANKEFLGRVLRSPFYFAELFGM